MMTGGGTSEEPAATADASMSRPSRAEAAGEEPELTHEQAQAQKARARRETLTLRGQIDTQRETLDFLLLQEDELSTKVEGKPSVYAQLEAGRAGEVRAPRHPPLAGAGVVCWKQMQTTRHNTSTELSPAAASASAGASSSGAASDADVVEVFEYRGRDYIRADQAEAIMTPKPKGTKEDKKKAQRDALHRQRYDKQVKDGVFSAESSAVYDGKSIKEQSECPHPFESLRWNPNQHGIFAKCTLCKLKSMIA